MAQEKRMGRGLRALIGSEPEAEREVTSSLPIEGIRPSSIQPRIRMDEDAIEDLARSIKAHGVLLPLLVRKSADGYEIVAGERRWRAAKIAGLTEVPVRIVDAESDGKALEIALVENVQREDLDPISRARALRRLTEVFSLTQEQIAARVGLERSTIANLIRLLDLPQAVQEMVSRETISAGHARALLALGRPEDIERAAEKVARSGMTVRDAEALARERSSRTAIRPPRRSAPAWAGDLEGRLVESLGVRVCLERRSKGWRISIECSGDEELGRVSDRILGHASPSHAD